MAFQFKVARTFRSSLMRQIWEAVKIHGSKATIVLNSKAEWMQPAIDRIVVTREPQDRHKTASSSKEEVMKEGGGWVGSDHGRQNGGFTKLLVKKEGVINSDLGRRNPW